MKRLISTYFFCLLFCAALSGQGLKGWTVEPNLYFGKILKHTPKLLFDTDHMSFGAEVNFLFQTHGRKEWNELHRYPLLGLAFTYYRLGDPNILGTAYGLLPNINVPIYTRNKWKVYFQLGTGVAYLTKQFNELTNPTFNAIGSNINTIANIEFMAGYRVNKAWTLSGGFTFTHYSNGGGHLPNFGLNIPALSVGARYAPKPVSPKDFIHHGVSKKAVKKFGITANAALAFRERVVSGGPSYPVYIGSIGGLYYLNRVNRLIAGVEYEYNKGAYAFGTHVYEFNSEREAKWRSSRLMVYVADEFLFGDWSLTLLVGTYAGDFYQVNFPIYNKLITRYYFPPVGKVRMHVGLYLKSHIVIAEYIGIGVGMAM